MIKKKLAIISSYGEACGNAAYTEALRKEFIKQNIDVEILALDVGLLNHKKISKLGDDHIRNMAKRLSEFDYVNIQFEVGLFGPPVRVLKRLKILAEASKNLIVTLHRYDLPLPYVDKGLVYSLLKLRVDHAIKKVLHVMVMNHYAKLYKDIIQYCKNNNIAIMVHTKREKSLVQNIHGSERVYDHPLTFLSEEDLQAHQKNASKEAFKRKYRLHEKDVAIGIFGFISPHKGYMTAIKAMKYLPDNYKLLIFGSQHPLSIKQNEEINPYLESLMTCIETGNDNRQKENKIPETVHSVAHKVKFCGALDDAEFLNAILCCDITILPYLEVNQSGSGVASLILDAGVNSIFSQNLAFIELAKYAKNCIKMFSIGNHLELANVIESYDLSDSSEGVKAYTKQFNMQTNIALHRKIFEENVLQSKLQGSRAVSA